MDTMIRIRVSAETAAMIESLARRLHVSKGRVLDKAIALYTKQVAKEERTDEILRQSFGSWKRDEPPERTVELARKAFEDAMRRH